MRVDEVLSPLAERLSGLRVWYIAREGKFPPQQDRDGDDALNKRTLALGLKERVESRSRDRLGQVELTSPKLGIIHLDPTMNQSLYEQNEDPD